MKAEKLQSLFFSYLENRPCDEIDGNYAEFDEPVRHPTFGDYFMRGGAQPSSTLQFFINGPLSPQSPSVTSAGITLNSLARQFTNSLPEKSHIQFKSTCVVEEPREQIISIPVIRVSCIDKEIRVSWKTIDKTAFSGTHYVGSSGEIMFGKGETKKIIEIKTLNFKDDANDIRFIVELCDVDGGFNPAPLSVILKKTQQFSNGERDVYNNLPRSLSFSLEDIQCALSDCYTSRTFHLALAHACSMSSLVNVQLALGFELCYLCAFKLPRDTILNVLMDYFRMDDFDF